jgi:hypothetical protein
MTQSQAHRIAAIAGVIAAAAFASACEERVETREVLVPTTAATIEIGPPVEHIRAAPEIIYEGHPVYWFHDRWYFRSGGLWNYYAVEPPALRPHRYVVRY